MTDARSRLIQCFKATFPELSEAEIPRASLSSVASWDSIAAMTLVVLIEEEFGVRAPLEDIADLVSFDLILDYLRSCQDVA
jgi:acyl carrier protein